MRCRGVILLLVIILFTFPIISSEDTEISPKILQEIKHKDINVIIEAEQPLENSNIELQPLTENLYSAKINKQDLKELIQEQNIQSITKDEIFYLQLSDSVPWINASIVHQLQNNSINLTGRAQTICIIDTGINTTHGAFSGRVIAEKCFCDITDLGGGGCCPDTTNEDDSATDTQGHGSHVAGIAAGNGEGILGVAPAANIIMVKVAYSTSAYFSDITQGFDWCINNASLYNITVISLSMGGGSYTTDCDSDYASLSSLIQDAWNKNISVTVATGNSGSKTSISSPACINKTISVSATTKTDAISSISNRNFLTDIFAPGESIISASYTSGTISKTGTSMSAPHVAGIIALLQQYKQEIEGRPLTAQEINDTLATNGTLIDDTTGSGRTFIRVDAYKALTAIDNLAPQLSYTNTSSSTNYIYTNITFLANATDINLKSVTLESNHTGSLANYSITTVSNNQYNYTLANNTFSAGSFQWRILVNDTHGNINASNWYNLTVYTGAPILTLSSPINNTLTNNNTITINFTIIDDVDLILNCTLYLDSILNQTKNVSNGSVSEFKINISEGIHNWNILCNDSQLLTTNSSLNFFEIDNTKPYFISESHPTTELGNNITFSVIANDTHLSYVNFSYDGINYSLQNTSTTFSKTFTTYQNGTNLFTTYSADSVGNINTTTNSFLVQDTITGPRIINQIYSSSVAYNSNQTITMFIVDSRGISSAKLSYNNINYTLTNNTYYNFTYSFIASTCGTNTFKIFTNDTQNNGITNTTTFSVTGCCGDGVCSSETCSTCAADCGTCSTTSTTSGGGGGGGGGSSVPTITAIQEENQTITTSTISYAPETTIQESELKGTIINEASPDNPINMKIDDMVTSLFITVNEQVSNIEVKVESLDTIPTSIPTPKEQVFKYFYININNLNYSSINNANISFKVSKLWITENLLISNSIKLQRYTTSWKDLDTTLDSEDNDYYYYTANTPGFSYFAITGKKEHKLNWIIIALGILFILIALILFLVHELKQNEE